MSISYHDNLYTTGTTLSFNCTQWSAGTAKSTIRWVPVFFLGGVFFFGGGLLTSTRPCHLIIIIIIIVVVAAAALVVF